MSVDDDTVLPWARRVKCAQDRNASLPPMTASLPLDIPAAYAIAACIHRDRLAAGARPVGRKIGFTNRNLWDQYGVHQPIWGWMYEHTVSRAVEGRARLALTDFAEPKIEPEIAFRFASAPPRRADPADLLACIDWVAHGFEIVQSHFPGWKFRAADTIADNGLHAALVLGEPMPVTRLGAGAFDALASFQIELMRDGEPVDTGRGVNVLDHPLHALAHLLALLDESPTAIPIAAGEIVTTGTLTAAHAVRAGETWHTRLRGIDLPGLTLSLTD